MKVYVCTDLEGVAGVVTFAEHAYPEGKYCQASKKLLTAEVNAAVEGMLDMDVKDILIGDWHGGGGIVFEDLHPAAKLMHGCPLAPHPVLDEAVKGCDVYMMIGQHAMAGVIDGNLNHTGNSLTVDYRKLNGKRIGEIASFALWQGAARRPMIFLSGDHAACREAEDLIPGVITVSVKQGLSRNSAISLSAPEARRRIREGVKKAIANHGKNPVAPLKWKGPYVLETRLFHTDVADAICQTSGAERVDSQTIRVHGDDIRQILYG
ncbi:MAG: M55 family metallopeptidase [Phycisphaerae bacterium]|jgi:D-amino peptidase|nr:M55 family metallopeptidase [Phycisphaerae bacterium]